MSSRRGWQGDWEGRKSTEWMGSIRNLRKKIPAFTQNIFRIGTGINKYKDLIVREPISDVKVDLGHTEAITRERIPIEAVRNSYRTSSPLMGYKLFEHQKMLDDVLEVLDEYPLFSAVRKPDLEATLSQAQARVDRFLEKQDRVKLLRFRQILSELFNEGKEVFRYGEHAVRLANLTRALNQLADEAET